MSRGVFLPSTQVRLTNVAVVRLSKGGKRFEVACYRNKVVNWRNKVETDIDEVLQIDNVFTNVSKGVLAKSKELQKAFGTSNLADVCKVILDKGEMQVSDKERAAHYDGLFRDVATTICEKCVNPASNRPYTVAMIQSSLKGIGFSVNPTRGAKQQALDAIKQLQEVMPIERAKMKLRVTADAQVASSLQADLQQLGVEIVPGAGSLPPTSGKETQHAAQEWVAELVVQPHLYREVEQCITSSSAVTGCRASLEIVDLSVQEEGEADMDVEMARRKDNSALGPKEGKLSPEGSSGRPKAIHGPPPENPKGGSSSGKEGKKGKKAKRREKEEAAEREERRQQQASREKGREHKVREGAEGAEGRGEEPAVDAGNKKKCCTCRAVFNTVEQHREHFKGDWHRYNLKLKLQGAAPIVKEEFDSVDAEEFFFANR